MYSYRLNENSLYIPIHMNKIFGAEKSNFEKDNIDQLLVNDVKSEILKLQYENYILDFAWMKFVNDISFIKFIQEIQSLDKGLIFINLSDVVYDFIKNASSDEFLCSDESTTKMYNNQGQVYCESVDILEIVAEFKIDFVKHYLKNNSIPGPQYLESSNIWSNMYINIKKTFVDTEVFNFFIYEMCNLIMTNFDKNKDFNYLVCASNNGAALATIIGQVLNIEVLYLMNLGPHLTLRDREFINKIKKDKKYLFVFDFICLGTELKMAKTIVRIKKADVVGAVGVAKFLAPSKMSVLALADLYNDDKVKYEVTVRKS